jgi:hypothetical protein
MKLVLPVVYIHPFYKVFSMIPISSPSVSNTTAIVPTQVRPLGDSIEISKASTVGAHSVSACWDRGRPDPDRGQIVPQIVASLTRPTSIPPICSIFLRLFLHSPVSVARNSFSYYFAACDQAPHNLSLSAPTHTQRAGKEISNFSLGRVNLLRPR